jgi:hypothetical protein
MSDWELPYIPRKEMVSFHQRDKRYAFLICHRRFGKTVACVAELVLRAIYTQKKNAQFAYIAPFRSQAKAVAWQYLVEMTEGLATEVRVSELSVTLPNGSKIFLTGSDNVNALRGLYLDGAVLDEFAQCRPDLLEAVIMPCLLDRQGWLVIIGTAYGRMNKFYDYYEMSKSDDKWYHADIKINESGVIPDDEIKRIQSSVSKAKFEQEFMNSFTAELVGTYYASILSEMEQEGKLHGDDLYDPGLPVKAAADIGRGDSTVFWFWQERPDGIAVIDLYANHGESAGHYINMLQSRGYKFDEIWLPHDARAKTFATNKSALEQFVDAFGAIVHITPSLSVEDGIEATRQILPMCRFDAEKCYEGIECLRVYRKKWDELNQCFLDKPLHDFSSDFADAARYMAIVAKKPALKAPPESLVDPFKPTGYNLHQLFAERERPRRGFERRRL